MGNYSAWFFKCAVMLQMPLICSRTGEKCGVYCCKYPLGWGADRV